MAQATHPLLLMAQKELPLSLMEALKDDHSLTHGPDGASPLTHGDHSLTHGPDGASPLTHGPGEASPPLTHNHDQASTRSTSYQFIKLNREENPTPGLSTTLASSISKVLGGTLREFDQLRHALKDAKKSKNKRANIKDQVSRYNNLTATLSLKVLARKTNLDKRLKELEHEHFKKHQRLPGRHNSLYTELLSQRNHAKAILRNLNIGL